MRKPYFLLALFIFSNAAFAERNDPMMLWPQLVQIDWDAYHGKIIESCSIKFPEYANSFKADIDKWNGHNTAAIVDIRRQIKTQIKSAKGLSESEITNKVNLVSKMWTERFIKIIATTSENEWKETCAGKYATETLPAMDFARLLPIVSKEIPKLKESYIFPEN